jgi:glycosyltransferase involved in cell wall biosynthesis
VRFAGYKSGRELFDEVSRAMVVVFPSECYENNPRSIIEAFALGKPVVASNIGGIPELVRDGDTGMLFEARDGRGCAARLKALLDDPQLCAGLGARCRAYAQRRFGADAHYDALMAAYERAAAKRRAG